MDSLLIVNGCSCDSLATATANNSINGSTSPESKRRLLTGKTFANALTELENLEASSTERLVMGSKQSLSDEDQVSINTSNVVPSSPLKRPRLALAPNASPLIPGSEATSTEDVWQAFNGFLADDAIITTCQEEPGHQLPSTNDLSFSEFVKRYNELSEWLGRIQQSITSTAGMSRAEVYLHQTVHADLTARHADRRAFNEYGRALLALRCGPLSDPSMQREIAGYLQSLAQRWQVVERAVTSVSGDSEKSESPPCIDQVFADLEADLELLRNWIDNTEESLNSCRLPPSCLSRCGTRTETEEKHIQECVSLLFDRCKALQVQIQSQQRFISAVRRLSDRLANGSQEFLPPQEAFDGASSATVAALIQEKADAHRAIAEQLENRWQQLWLVSLEVHCRLENILSGHSAPRNEVIRPISGHDLFATVAYSDSNSTSGSRSVSSSRSFGFTSAFAPKQGNDSESRYRSRESEIHTTASNSLDILPFSENEYEHIGGGGMMESTDLLLQQGDPDSTCQLLRRTHSEADCSLDRTPVKNKDMNGEFGLNRNNYSPKGGRSHYANSKARRARSETYGSQYQMYFAVSDDSEGHYLDELTSEALNGARDYAHCSHQLALTLPRTTSSDSPLPTSADFISTNDTPSSGSGGGADSGRGVRSANRPSTATTASGERSSQKPRRYRRSAKESRYRRRRYQHAATAADIASVEMGGQNSFMQRSLTYNENLVRESSTLEYLTVPGENGRASSLDGIDPQAASRRMVQKTASHHRRQSRVTENSQSSSLYSSDASGTESGCSADGEPGDECIEENDRLHSTDAVRAAMHRFRWKYCRRGAAGRYAAAHRSSSLNSVDTAHKYSISESAIQELHEIYEAYCAKYSHPSIAQVRMAGKNQVGEHWISATASSTTTTMLSPEDQQAIGLSNEPSSKNGLSLKQAACRNWESESSSLNKNWKRLIALGQDVAAPSNFAMAEDSPQQACDTANADGDSQQQMVPVASQYANGLLTLATNKHAVEELESSDGGMLSSTERGGEREDAEWDAFQPPVYTASSDDGDEDQRRARLLLSEEGLAVDDDNFLFGGAESGDNGEVQDVTLMQDEQQWSPRRRRLYQRRRPAASLTSVLEYAAASLDDVMLGLNNIRLAVRNSTNIENLSADCRQLLEIADDNLAQLQEVSRRLAESHHAPDLIERVDAIVAVWQRVLADLLGEQRRADDLARALDELHDITEVIPAIEQRLGLHSSCSSAASSDSDSKTSGLSTVGIFRFDSASSILEASEESLRIAASISQLQSRASSILLMIQQAGNGPLQEQVDLISASLEKAAEFNEGMRTRCDQLHSILLKSQSVLELCESDLARIEQTTGSLQTDLTVWASSNVPDLETSVRLTLAIDECEHDLERIIETSLTDLESRFQELLTPPAISDQAAGALRTRIAAIRARLDGERGRLDTLRIAISLASCSPSPKSPPAQKDSTAQTLVAASTSVDAQTLPIEQPKAEPVTNPAPTSTNRSWTRRLAKLLFPAQLAIVSIFLILRFLEPFELPIRVTPLLQFNHGPPPV